MKKRKTDIKKTIQKKIELKQEQYKRYNTNVKKMGRDAERHAMRTGASPRKPVIPVELVNSSLTNDRMIARLGGKVKTPELLDSKFLEPYEKRQVVDYDAVIIISSFNRFIKLNRILKQLHEQETKYKIKIIVCNDGSNDINYGKLPKMYPEIDYYKNPENYGKHRYWMTITELFQKAAQYVSHVVIQIDDDFLLCNNFVDKLIDWFFMGKEVDNKNVATHYHLPAGHKKRNWWGMPYGIDGGAIFDTKFLAEINNSITPISGRRWAHSPELSSGVWKQVSEKIHKNGLCTYNLEYSLAQHDGNEDSKMNTSQRNRSPINTENFKKK